LGAPLKRAQLSAAATDRAVPNAQRERTNLLIGMPAMVGPKRAAAHAQSLAAAQPNTNS